MKASIAWSFVTILAASLWPTTTAKGERRANNPVVDAEHQRKLYLDHDFNWRDYFPTADSHSVLPSEDSGSEPVPAMAPAILAVVESRYNSGKGKGKGKSKKASKSKKAKGKKHTHHTHSPVTEPSVDSSSSDDGPSADDDDDSDDSNEDHHSESESPKKKRSKASSDHYSGDCYYTDGIWIGDECSGKLSKSRGSSGVPVG